MSNLTKTLAVVSLLAPGSAQPLGIGDIELHSALNQNLNAEIRLNVADGENPSDISVRLAPLEKFDQAGVPWNYFLSKVKFQPVVQANGSIIVKITSREALTEPFLNFLLEVSWPQGSQFREFTVLVDPPSEYRQPVIPTAESNGYRVEPLEDYQRPAQKTRSAARRAARAQSASTITPQTPTNGEYGPTQTADTLWNIANRLAEERSVPAKQMMNALFHANPKAFNRGNMDSLKTGVVLKIPESEAILKGAPSKQSAESKPAPSGNKALELVAPAESKIADNAVVSAKVKPGQERADDSGASAETDSATSSASGGKDIELQARIEKLEQQLGMMQQLLALKDQQLATLQQGGKPPVQPAEQPAQPPQLQPAAQTPPATQATPQPATAPAPEPAKLPASQAPVTAQTPAPTSKPKKVIPKPAPTPVADDNDLLSSPGYYLTVGGMGAGILGLLGWLWWRKRRIDEQTNTESMFASASQIKMPDGDSSLAVPVIEMNSSGAYDVGTVGESSFISDFTPSDFDAFDTDQNEVDPLSEADVYLAYGRYQQAEDLIRHAIAEQPNRDECKLKLLEIYYANENKEGFAAYAQELADAGKQADRQFWTKVSDMAQEIIPDSTLFGGSGLASEQETADFSKSVESPETDARKSAPANFEIDTNDDLIDLNASTLPDLALMDDINSELAELELTSPKASASDDNGLDFDLSSFSETPVDNKSEDAPVGIETIDFDLSNLALDDALSEKLDTDEIAGEQTLESFDFNFENDNTEKNAEANETIDASDMNLGEPLDMASLESFEFPEFESIDDDSKVEIAQPSASAPTAVDVVDEFDFNFDFDAPSEKENAAEDFNLGVSDLTDMDELETKIDLAKAYIDMGDADAAKAIAEEVLAKGSQEQKQAAQAILDELD